MTVTLELKPEIEDLVKAEAEARGLSVEAYIQQELESKLFVTCTIDLKPEIENHLKAEAQARGLSVEDYILDVLERETPNGESEFALTASPEEWKKSFLEWVNSERPPHPPLSDEAINRESIYREREDAQL